MDVFLLLLLILAAATTVLVAARRGKVWILAAIAVHLVIANVLGSQLVTLHGWPINIGNIFYATAFLATQAYLESSPSKKKRFTPLYLGAFFLFSFVIIFQIVALFIAQSNGVAGASLSQTITVSVRIMAASLLAYVFAQHGHIDIYTFLQARWQGRAPIVRSMIANTLA